MANIADEGELAQQKVEQTLPTTLRFIVLKDVEQCEEAQMWIW